MHFDFESVHVYFYIDLMSSLSNNSSCERSERSEHTVVLSLRFLYIYIYSVTKILRKIRATTFTEKIRKITREGDERQG